ncbi:MAG: isocitrate lyase/phosphoenolpyruvate mutase family protein [Betaproteobacteria bacterium]|nr:isocitrate lyase/phosphoenolpyruvate mutase family protein [Betaproteobacteria bacterium]
MSDQDERAERFAALHAAPGAFIIPNPWDPGSARMLAGLGFESLASTSWGAAVALGQLDGEVSRDAMIEHVRQLSAATGLPLSVDLENCYAHDPREAAQTLLLAAAAGAVGGSIEDYSLDPEKPIYDFSHAVERVQAAVEAVRRLDFHFTLTARAENLLRGVNDLDDTIRRLQAFEAAGADVLYAPGLTTLEQVRTVCGALSKPVNVLAPQVKGATLASLAEAGAKRLSVGGALARAAVGALLRAAREMREQGSFGWTAELASLGEVKRLLGTPGA